MEEKVTSDLIGQREVRLQKLAKLKELGISPYPGKSYKRIVLVIFLTILKSMMGMKQYWLVGLWLGENMGN